MYSQANLWLVQNCSSYERAAFRRTRIPRIGRHDSKYWGETKLDWVRCQILLGDFILSDKRALGSCRWMYTHVEHGHEFENCGEMRSQCARVESKNGKMVPNVSLDIRWNFSYRLIAAFVKFSLYVGSVLQWGNKLTPETFLVDSSLALQVIQMSL